MSLNTIPPESRQHQRVSDTEFFDPQPTPRAELPDPKEHIERLYASAHVILLKIPLSKDEMVKAVIKTLQANKLKDA
jgi:branched-subunit amino acid aminotransferase/4-amino-4-deoxychorismate lyase